VSGWVDVGWLLAGGFLTVGIVFVVLVATEKARKPVVRGEDGRWRAAPRLGGRR